MSVYSKLFGEYYGLADSLVENVVKVKFTSKEGSKEINFTWHEDFSSLPLTDIKAAASKGLLLAYATDRKGVRNIRLVDIDSWQVLKSLD
tara:strand:- start:135 stop:404 length:270 start_codon:yes stop_codon:yes gene_type:complete